MSHPDRPDWKTPGFQQVHLERLKLAADVILSEANALPAPLEEELTIFRDRVERALLRLATPPTATN